MPSKRHGLSLSTEYVTWRNMLARCRRANHPSYHRYGARGISVCARWSVFENFLADMGPRPSADHSLDRIDNNGVYEPRNCRWATKSVQMANKEQTCWITGFGETLTKQAFCRKHGLHHGALELRLARGMTPEQAVEAKKIPYNFKFTPKQTQKIKALYKTKKYRLRDLAEKFGVATMTIQRIVKGTYWRNHE